ncbi:Like-Sm (LSM) domain [Pseudocohnilembus persalinus]|uniref:Like-Sm (LSM) domain n=1 Tax=Pseudocohnilembus persalinus TaxID=266149 RepID=A0A0V0R4D8_PSEPJ|nr:Like-Sm (LSM) domain [Pseudocohnilembus persalinus]|eukprot:KRX09356.1 Like-Sm (LSM) domain [Pseudocohnilembus persalinus]
MSTDNENFEQLKQKFQNLTDQHIIVTLQDDRKIYGMLQCFDNQKNLVLLDGIEEIDTKYISQINEKLQNLIRYDNWFLKHNPQFTDQFLKNPELAEQVNKKWMKNKFFLGQIILPGKQVKKIEQVQGYKPSEAQLKLQAAAKLAKEIK